MTNPLQQPSKTSQTNTTSQNQTNAKAKPRLLAPVATPVPPCPSDGSGSGITGTITFPNITQSGPTGVAFNPMNCDVYVANGQTNTVSVIDGSTNAVIKIIPLPNDDSQSDVPSGGVAVDTATGNVFVGVIIRHQDGYLQ